MKTSSVSLKSILSTSGLVLSLISSSFKTSSGSSSKNIIFSISRRLRISFLKPNSNWNREGNFLLDLLLTCSWDSLQLWFWGGRLSHFWVGHTYNWLVDCQHTWDLPQRDRPLRFEQGRCWSGPGGSEKKIQEGSHILANYTKYTKHLHQHHLFYLELVVPMTVTLVWEGRSCSSSSLRATSCARPEKLDHFIQSLFTCSKRISSDKDVVVRMARQHIRDFGNGRPCQSLSTGSKTSVSNALKNESCLPGAGFGGQVFERLTWRKEEECAARSIKISSGAGVGKTWLATYFIGKGSQSSLRSMLCLFQIPLSRAMRELSSCSGAQGWSHGLARAHQCSCELIDAGKEKQQRDFFKQFFAEDAQMWFLGRFVNQTGKLIPDVSSEVGAPHPRDRWLLQPKCARQTTP